MEFVPGMYEELTIWTILKYQFIILHLIQQLSRMSYKIVHIGHTVHELYSRTK